MTRCPACLAPCSPAWRVSARLEIRRCRACGHRVGNHPSGPDAPASQDIHAQYDQGAFLDALRVTRERQARVALSLIARQESRPDRLLDYGSGRGWFIEAAREAGYRELAGADISPLALDWLRERGVAAIRIDPESPDPGGALASLPFRPKILSFLDVVEHFTVTTLEPTLRSLVRALSPELQWILIKVPSSGGLLYRTASIASRTGLTRPLERLWQVGSLTPHHHAFSVRSARAFIARMGWKLADRVGDPDFEPETLLVRARGAGAAPRGLDRAVGAAATGLIRAFGLHDTQIYLIAVK